MTAPTEPILIIATDTLSSDGYTNKEAPSAPVTNKGFSKQSLSYQKMNYLFNNQAQWLTHFNERGVAEWQPLISYPKAAKVQYQDNFYTSLEDSNVGNTPVVGGDISWLQDISNRRFATNTEAITGTDATLVLNPVQLKVVADALQSHEDDSNPHSDSQATSDWVVTSGTLSNGDTVPIPAGFALADCHILVTTPESWTGDWDLDEGVTATHYQTTCRVVAGVVESFTKIYQQYPTPGYDTYSVDADYILVGRKGSF